MRILNSQELLLTRSVQNSIRGCFSFMTEVGRDSVVMVESKIQFAVNVFQCIRGEMYVVLIIIIRNDGFIDVVLRQKTEMTDLRKRTLSLEIDPRETIIHC